MSLNYPNGDLEAGTENDSPIIKMPGDKRQVVETKLAEYRARLVQIKNNKGQDRVAYKDLPFIAPERLAEATGETYGNMPSSEEIGTVYKIRIAEELLRSGQVNTYELSRKLAQEHGNFNAKRFGNACGVLLSYCEGRRS